MLLLVLISKLVIASLLLGSSLFIKGRSFLFAYRKRILFASVLIIFAALIYISVLQYQFWNSNEYTKSLNSDQSFAEELQKYGVDFAAVLLDPLFRGINSSIKFIFPSYTGGTYLLFFLLTRLWGEYIISLIFAMLFLWTMLFLNHKYESRFFYDEEPYFGAIAIFLTGWPGWLYYLIILLSLFLIFNAVATVRAKREESTILGHPMTENGKSISGSSDVGGGRMSGEVGSQGHRISETARFSLYYFWLPVAIIIILLMANYQTELPYYALLKI